MGHPRNIVVVIQLELDEHLLALAVEQLADLDVRRQSSYEADGHRPGSAACTFRKCGWRSARAMRAAVAKGVDGHLNERHLAASGWSGVGLFDVPFATCGVTILLFEGYSAPAGHRSISSPACSRLDTLRGAYWGWSSASPLFFSD